MIVSRALRCASVARSSTKAAHSPCPSWIGPGQRKTAAMLRRSEEHTSELQSLMRISYAVFCLKKKKTDQKSDLHRQHDRQRCNTTHVVKKDTHLNTQQYTDAS